MVHVNTIPYNRSTTCTVQAVVTHHRHPLLIQLVQIGDERLILIALWSCWHLRMVTVLESEYMERELAVTF
jgi:hypothetical protein